DRFGQIEPKVLFSADGYFYSGKTLDSLATIGEVARQLPSLRQIVVIPYVSQSPRLEQLGPAHTYAAHWEACGRRGASLQFTPLPFDHPLYILFSS
ncbi:acetoacetyl-CoA synthetase, partial [mine drainage metagenome]